MPNRSFVCDWNSYWNPHLPATYQNPKGITAHRHSCSIQEFREGCKIGIKSVHSLRSNPSGESRFHLPCLLPFHFQMKILHAKTFARQQEAWWGACLVRMRAFPLWTRLKPPNVRTVSSQCFQPIRAFILIPRRISQLSGSLFPTAKADLTSFRFPSLP